MIRAIFFDIDGTLISFRHPEILLSTKNALMLLKEKGIKLFIATGRHILELQEEIIINKMYFDGYITVNGQYCYNDNDIIYKDCICRKDIQIIIDLLNRYKYPCTFFEKDKMYMNMKNENVRVVQELLKLPDVEVKDINRALENDIFQMMAYIKADEEELVMSALKNCICTRWNPYFVDIAPAGGSKSIGIDKFLEYYGISLDETMAFGDGENDIGMLKHVSIGVAMGNSSAIVKDNADYITDDIDEDGIYNALKHFKVI